MISGTSRTVVLVTSTARTTSDNGKDLVLVEGFTAVRVRLDVTAASGTSPTLNVYVQQGIRTPLAADLELEEATGSIEYDDYISFTQATGVSTRYGPSVGGGADEHAQRDGTLTPGTIVLGALGTRWRVKWIVGGTNPSFTFSVVAELIP